MSEPRLFALAALLIRREPNGSLSMKTPLGFRICEDGEDAMLGRYVRDLMANADGFALQGKVLVLEITKTDLTAGGMA